MLGFNLNHVSNRVPVEYDIQLEFIVLVSVDQHSEKISHNKIKHKAV